MTMYNSIYNPGDCNVTLGYKCNYKNLFILSNAESRSINLTGVGRKCYIDTNKNVDIRDSIKDCYILNSGIIVM